MTPTLLDDAPDRRKRFYCTCGQVVRLNAGRVPGHHRFDPEARFMTSKCEDSYRTDLILEIAP